MKRRSLSARLWAIVMSLTLGISQVMLAAFACPLAAAPQMSHVSASAEEGCHEADPGSRHLCAKTCEDEPQKHETPSLSALPPALDEGLRIDLPSTSMPDGRHAVDFSLAHATSPPFSILFSRFLE